MSEKVLKAILQLLALIAREDGVLRVVGGGDRAVSRVPIRGLRRILDEPVEHFADAEVSQGGAEIDRCQRAVAIGFEVELVAGTAHGYDVKQHQVRLRFTLMICKNRS